MRMRVLLSRQMTHAHKNLEMWSNTDLGNFETIWWANNSTRTKAAAVIISISCSHCSYIMKPLNAHTRPALLEPITQNFFFWSPRAPIIASNLYLSLQLAISYFNSFITGLYISFSSFDKLYFYFSHIIFVNPMLFFFLNPWSGKIRYAPNMDKYKKETKKKETESTYQGRLEWAVRDGKVALKSTVIIQPENLHKIFFPISLFYSPRKY